MTSTNFTLPKISAPAIRALASIGVTRLDQLTEHTEEELLQLHGFGPKAIRVLTPILQANGLAFKKTEAGEK